MYVPCKSLLAASIALAISPAFAQQGADDDAHVLDHIVVTAAAPTSPSTFELDPKLPRQPVPASDGADYLRTVAGFNAIRSGGSNADPVLRGLSGSRLNLQVGDGALHGACPARMDNAMSYVSPETFDRVIIVKGPQTVLWGPVGSAGTVRFERDAPVFASSGVHVDASALVASYGRNDQVLDAAIGTATVYARFTGNHARADDYEDGEGAVVPSRWMKWNADAQFGWTPNQDTLLFVAAGSGDGEARYAGRSMDGTQFRRDSGTVGWRQRNVSEHWAEIDVRAYSHDVDHVMDNYGLRAPDPHSSMPMPMVAAVARRSTGGRAALTWRWPTLELIAGVDQQDSRHRHRSGMGIGAHRSQPWQSDALFSQYGAFAEASVNPESPSRWVAGVRVDRVRVRDLREGTMHMPHPTHGERRSDTLPGGFIRFEHDASRRPLGFHVGIGSTERFPDYWELFSYDMGPMASANAFAGIQPERTTQLDIGLDYRGADVRTWLSAYAGRISDFILFDYRDTHGGGMDHGHGRDHGDDHGHGGAAIRTRNIQASIRGAEMGVEWQLTPSVRMENTLAYAWGENRDDGQPLPQIAPLEARMALTWTQGDWSLGSLYRVVAGQSRSAPGFGNVVGQDLGDSGGFALLSLNARYRIRSGMGLSLGIDNVFGRTYSEHLNLAGDAGFGYPAHPTRIHEPGRNVWLKFDLRYR